MEELFYRISTIKHNAQLLVERLEGSTIENERYTHIPSKTRESRVSRGRCRGKSEREFRTFH
jgi:hypothetical protein